MASEFEPTPGQAAELRRLIGEMRAVAGPVGMMHSWWDDIFDMEAMLSGAHTMQSNTVDEQIGVAKELLAARHPR